MVSAAIYANDVAHNWASDGTSLRKDVLCFGLALLIHLPLWFMRIDAHKHQTDQPKDRLVSVDLLEQLAPEKQPEAPPAPEAPKNTLMERLKMLVKKEPPPPAVVPPKPIEPPKPVDAPKPIQLQANLNTPPPVAPKLEQKTGFKTTLPPEQVAAKQLELNNQAPAGIAPLSAQKLGTITDRAAAKKDRGNFQVADNEKISSIDDSKPTLAGANVGPAIQIRTGAAASTEKFSAPVPQKSDKGRIGAIAPTGIGEAPMGLRDKIIARDAAPSQIAGVGGTVAGNGLAMPPPATKQDAGRFGGTPGGAGIAPAAPVGGTIKTAPAVPVKAREKKSMFTITGPLSDRKILKQVAPEYPAWAQAQGIEASVVLEFTVDSLGNVKPNIIVRRTSGYQKLDETAIDALRQWKFVPLEEVNKDEVGLITFNYSLH